MFFQVVMTNELPNQKPCGEPRCFHCMLFIFSDFGRFLSYFFIHSGKTHFGQSDSRPLLLSQAHPPRSDTLLVSFRVVVVVIQYLEGGMWSLAASKSADFQRQE